MQEQAETLTAVKSTEEAVHLREEGGQKMFAQLRQWREGTVKAVIAHGKELRGLQPVE